MTRLLKRILALSIIMNILAGGFIAGQLASSTVKPPRPDPYEIASGLPEPLAREVREIIDTTLERHRASRPQFGDGQEQLMAILTAPEFDAQAFRNQLRVLDRLHEARHMEMTELAVTIASKLNQQQRKEMARQLRRSAPPID